MVEPAAHIIYTFMKWSEDHKPTPAEYAEAVQRYKQQFWGAS